MPSEEKTPTKQTNAADSLQENSVATEPLRERPRCAWHAASEDEVFATLRTAPTGLASTEAAARLAHLGPNQLSEHRRAGAWKRFLLQFHNPLIYVLGATSVVTALLGHWVDTGVIVGVVLIDAVIGFVQESKAEQALESLKQMLAPSAIILRDNVKQSVPAVDLVPGDIVTLQSGDKVPTDLRILKQKNLRIDEAALTGESLAVSKYVDIFDEKSPLADRFNMAFAGTLATTGSGQAVVVSTGDDTELGKIAGMLGDVKSVDTPLIRRLAEFSKLITIAVVVFSVVIFLVGILSGQSAVQMLMAAVALAVSAIPEGLPAIMTIALAIGVKRMASRNAVIRKLPAVEALGSATVICTDKTGTLTRNEMTVTKIVTAEGRYSVRGSGYIPTGEFLDQESRPVNPIDHEALHSLLIAGALCNEAALTHKGDDWSIEGDTTEGSLLVLAEKAGLSRQQLAHQWTQSDLLPFESEQQFMASLHHDHSRHGEIFLKGAPERVIAMSGNEGGGADKFDDQDWKAATEELAAQGLRVLAIAKKNVEPDKVILDFDDAKSGFELLGLVGMIDPPRTEAVQAVERCQAAGIRVKMITGDHAATAEAVAHQIGIGVGTKALSGSELDQLGDEEFDHVVETYDVFARVSPTHKLKFVQSLQKQGEIVSMTGDGVNDAPALKQADIGVAMGVTGTEVSKEAAEMVLLDDNFASIEIAIEEGRTVYNNLKKTILFILPTNGGECLTLIAAMFLGLTLPILPIHILWINLVTTVSLAITLAFDPVDADVMSRPPRHPKAALIDRVMVWRITYVSVLMALGTFGLFYYEIGQGASEQVARSVAVNAIVFFEVAYLLNSRHITDSVMNRRGLLGNRIVWIGIGVVTLFQIGFTYLPAMCTMFGVAPLLPGMWVRLLVASLILFFLVEGEKWLSRRIQNGAATD